MKGRKGFTLTELRGVIVISTLLLSIVTPAPCAANDWPCWLGPAHNGISAETGLLKEWPENGPPVLYEVPIGPGYSSPSISDGRMITMHQSDRGQCVIAFDEKSGQRLWETPIDSAFKDGAGDGPR